MPLNRSRRIGIAVRNWSSEESVYVWRWAKKYFIKVRSPCMFRDSACAVSMPLYIAPDASPRGAARVACTLFSSSRYSPCTLASARHSLRACCQTPTRGCTNRISGMNASGRQPSSRLCDIHGRFRAVFDVSRTTRSAPLATTFPEGHVCTVAACLPRTATAGTT